MKRMVLWVVQSLCVVFLASYMHLAICAPPNDVLVINAGNVTEPETPELGDENLVDAPVSYNGAQLWRIPFDDQDKKNAVAELQNTFDDIAMWGTNGTSVDLMLKKPIISSARLLLEDAHVKFDVLIEDLQKAIETENPPKAEIELLQNRKARSYNNRQKRFRKFPAAQLTFLPPPPTSMPQSLYPGYRSASRLRYQRLKGALMGYNSLDPPLQYWPDAKWGHRMTWSAYHRLDDIHGYVDYLANTYPDLCSVQTIGKSVQGRDIKVLRISNGNPTNKAIFMDGGIHAREWISPAVITYIVDKFAEDWDEQPDSIRNIDWYVIPVLNPDGYEYTHTVDRLWRKNRGGPGTGRCAGVDLNRNFGYKWGGQGGSRQPCAETFAGTSAFSEPESKAMKDFLEHSAADFRGYISFHSYGQYILYPWGYEQVVPPDHKDLDRIGKLAAENMKKVSGLSYSVGPAANTLYPAAGGSDDWAKGQLKIKYSYTVELRDSGRYGFILPASQIEKTGREGMAFVQTVAQAVMDL